MINKKYLNISEVSKMLQIEEYKIRYWDSLDPKTNKYRILDLPELSGYVRDLYQKTGIADTVNMEHIKQHYYYSHNTINPSRIVPEGPELNFFAPHQRHQQFV